MSFELSGMEVLSGIVFLTILVVIGIAYYKYFHSLLTPDLRPNNGSFSLSERAKHPKNNILRHRSLTFGVGMACSIAFAVIAMSWTTYERQVETTGYIGSINNSEIEVVALIQQPLPPPPPPPPQLKIEIIKDEFIPEDNSDILESSIEEHSFIDEYVPVMPKEEMIAPPPPPMPEPEPEAGTKEIFRIVEQMPLFGDCTDKECSEKALLNFIYSSINYPAIARENNIEGRVTAEFIIEKDGEISGIKLLRGIGGGCDEEVLRVLNKMNNNHWTAGRQRGVPVRVSYVLPVTFKLNI